MFYYNILFITCECEIKEITEDSNGKNIYDIYIYIYIYIYIVYKNCPLLIN